MAELARWRQGACKWGPVTERRTAMAPVATLVAGLICGLTAAVQATPLTATLSCLTPRASALPSADCASADPQFGKDQAFQQHHVKADASKPLPLAMLAGDVILVQSLRNEAVWVLPGLKDATGRSGVPSGVLPASVASVTGITVGGQGITAAPSSIDAAKLRVSPAASSTAVSASEPKGSSGFAWLAALGAALTAIGLAARRWKRSAARQSKKRVVQRRLLRPLPAT